MNKFKYLPKELPDIENTFIISVTGNLTGYKYEGEFKCRIPNNKAKALISKNIALLNEGLDNTLNIAILDLHYMISYLKYTLVKSPDFWEESNNGYDLYDVNIIEEVYNKVLDFEKKWFNEVWKKDNTNKKDDKER